MRVRGWARRALIAVVSLAGLALTARGAMFVPAVYFHVAFSTIQRSSLMRDRVDWRALRAEADELRRGARSTADTYPAIRLVLQRLGDHHSHLSTPATMHAHRGGATWAPGLTVIGPERVVALVSPGGPADKAGIAVGDIVETVNGQAPSHALFLSVDGPAIDLTVRRPGDATARGVRLQPGLTVFNQPATVRRLKGRLGYIDVPGVVGGGGRFAEDAVRAIREVDAESTCAWVVDLRRNVGGNMWPMLLAVRPILGEATPGYFVSSGEREAFSYGPGMATPVYRLRRPDPPVAVLTSRLTGSAGEVLTIAFRGRPDTRSFGEATAGLPTANLSFPMVDGAVIVVTTSSEADRTGRIYEGRIEPDQRVEIVWSGVGSEKDPVLQVAASWLRGQPACDGNAAP
ncbi:MAG TPA: S41 family peptidase [Vicinamibacteria bacterium]|jgi:carboxyl-terminal processing protease|nr:S41 family peptidase [Vicinamibacteria bacterium]